MERFVPVIGVFLSAALFCMHLTTSANANDSSAELATGGLIFVKNNDVELLSENLLISTEEIRVTYRFLNKSNKDVTVYVAFPLPDLKLDPDDDVTVIPTDDPINFVGFVTTVDGLPVHAKAEQKVFVNERDQTQVLTRLGIPLSPYHSQDALAVLSGIDKGQLARLGLINENGLPLWTLKTTFYWQQRFSSGRETVIEHHYKPSVGSTVSVDSSSVVQSLKDDSYREYCVDADFLRELAKDKRNYFGERRIEYILKTGANWSGPIKEFRLVVDKGAPENLVSFCGQGVRKIGPTLFEMTKSDFIPQANIVVLILKRESPPPNNRDQSGQGSAEPSRSESAATPLGTTSCNELWYQRNNIFKAGGYCFKTPRAIRAFRNAGCQYDNLKDVPLSEKQRQMVDEITRLEAAKKCP